MTTPTAIRQPASHSSLRRLVARHLVAAMLITVFTTGRLSYKPERVSQPADAALQGGAPLSHA